MITLRFLVLFLGAFAMSQPSGAQTLRESAELGGVPGVEGPLPERVVPQGEATKRSALWMTVHMQHRESGSESALVQRRLTPTERMQLRDQVRRAAGQTSSGGALNDGLPVAPVGVPVGR